MSFDCEYGNGLGFTRVDMDDKVHYVTVVTFSILSKTYNVVHYFVLQRGKKKLKVSLLRRELGQRDI